LQRSLLRFAAAPQPPRGFPATTRVIRAANGCHNWSPWPAA